MAALADIARAPKPALVVCHGVVIRLALARLARTGGRAAASVPIANGALIAL
jgi:probable phosphoglycerate mutase